MISRRGAAALVVCAALVCVAAPSLASGGSSQPPNSVCRYLYEWLRVVRFPLQPDPHAAYTYVAISAPSAAHDHVGFLVQGAFPYAVWTSWDVYGKKAAPVGVANDYKIVPNRGSVNPFVVGSRVLASKRQFTLLYLPDGVNRATIAPSLRRVAASNVFLTPDLSQVNAFVLANRVYQAFPGYNMGGSGGPTRTPFPRVTAVNYDTGMPVSCSPYNLLPSRLQTSPTTPPRSGSTRLPASTIRLKDGTFMQRADSPTSPPKGFEYAPRNPPGLLRFTRPPLAAGADVSAIPPPDECAGYLGTATSVTRISLIRMPHVATYFDVSGVNSRTRFPDTESAYVSASEYGGSVGIYAPGRPITASLGDGEMAIDRSGGSTIVVWPRVLSRRQQRLVFNYANRHGWAILRGGKRNQYTTANLLIREKRSTDYRFGIDQVPCYFGTPEHPMHQGEPWSAVTGSQYIATPMNIGPGAPQGVTCTVNEFTGGDCLRRLKAYIRRTGGSYTAH